MKSKHTQGKWEVEMLGKYYKVATDEWLIASINECDQSEANAKLIAAAPKMLEALQIIVEQHSNSIRGIQQNTMDRIAEIIEKATK